MKVLWLQVAFLGIASLLKGNGVPHSVFEASLVAAFALAAVWSGFSRRTSSLFASLGLLTSSAVLVHLFEGRIEMHFSFFVMVGIVTWYQDWLPLLASIGYVVVQHGIGGAVNPSMVYDHEGAVENPWAWAAVHGGFILAMSAVGIVSWRMNESFQMRLNQREARLAEAQSVARLGIWQVDLVTRTVEWSEQFAKLLGIDADDLTSSVESFLYHVVTEDRPKVEAHLNAALYDGTASECDFRVRTRSGDIRWLHGRADIETAVDGTISVVAGTVQDVTARKRAETGLAETLSELSATLDSTADGVLVVSLSGVVTNFNGRFANLFGLPAHLRPPMPRDDVLSIVLAQLKNPDEFLRSLDDEGNRPGDRTEEIIELIDGRVIEYCRIPQVVNERTIGRVWSVRDITERVRLEQALSHQAFHDSLTNLANKALFADRVSHALTLAERDIGRVAVLFLDLDGFKTINDGLGHTAGDELLVAVAVRLRACIRAGDTAARLGGDEFAFLLEDVGGDSDAEDTANRLLEVLRDPFHVQDRDVYIRASIGIARAERGDTYDQLLRNADLAMYSAKRRGKNRVETFSEGIDVDPLAKLDLETALRRGLDDGEFSVHYQAVVEIDTGDIVGAEALARWNSPHHGVISPATFVPLAEDLGLIGELGEFVLETACVQVRQWQIDGVVPAEFSISVNLSTRQLEDHDVVQRVESVLRHSGLAPRNLVLEITESGVVSDSESTIDTLSDLRAAGVRIAIDDFGTGYSSLSYLQRLPVDILKIDQSFVAAIESGSSGASLAPAIVSLAETLNLRVVAEGVETEYQADTLNALGCALGQGYLFAHPVDPESMREILATQSTGGLPATLAAAT